MDFNKACIIIIFTAVKLDGHWVNATFRPAPGRSSSPGVIGGGREPGRWNSRF